MTRTRHALALLPLLALAGDVLAQALHVVNERDKAFDRETIAIRAGDSITFVNQDDFVHNIYSRTPGHQFDMGARAPGQADTVRFARPGTVEIRCAIHPKMRLTVTATE
jgi:plastocyanin